MICLSMILLYVSLVYPNTLITLSTLNHQVYPNTLVTLNTLILQMYLSTH